MAKKVANPAANPVRMEKVLRFFMNRLQGMIDSVRLTMRRMEVQTGATKARWLAPNRRDMAPKSQVVK
jgi:hypothetical protein